MTNVSSANPIIAFECLNINDSGPVDFTLMERVQSKDHQAMADVFDRHERMVYSTALCVLRDPGDAEDVMQEIFFQLWKKPDAFVPVRGSLGGWLNVIARNRAIDMIRSRKPTDSLDQNAMLANTNPALEAERNMLMDKVRDVLNDLPLEQQKTINLAYFEGCSHSEIAARTGDPLGTVKTRIRAALISLRKALAV